MKAEDADPKDVMIARIRRELEDTKRKLDAATSLNKTRGNRVKCSLDEESDVNPEDSDGGDSEAQNGDEAHQNVTNPKRFPTKTNGVCTRRTEDGDRIRVRVRVRVSSSPKLQSKS